MALKKFKPTTPGQRFKVISAFDEITTDIPEKSLLETQTRSGGRNSEGKMTMRYMGGGHKHQYRIVDFKRDKEGVPAKVYIAQGKCIKGLEEDGRKAGERPGSACCHH